MEDRQIPKLRKLFVTGLLFIIPIGVSYWFLSLLVRKTQGWARPAVNQLLGAQQPLVPSWVLTVISIILVVAFVMVVGGLANFYIGKKVLSLVDQLMLRVPVVRSIYGGTKQIIDAFAIQRSAGAFETVVLMEYPRSDCWVLGFVTNSHVERVEPLFGDSLVAVFVPSTPNPTTGFLLYLPAQDLKVVDMSVEEAVKLIVSAGIVVPEMMRRAPVTFDQFMKKEPASEELVVPE